MCNGESRAGGRSAFARCPGRDGVCPRGDSLFGGFTKDQSICSLRDRTGV